MANDPRLLEVNALQSASENAYNASRDFTYEVLEAENLTDFLEDFDELEDLKESSHYVESMNIEEDDEE